MTITDQNFQHRPDLYSEPERHLPERSGCFGFLNVSVCTAKRIGFSPFEPHGSEVRDRGVFFCALPETGQTADVSP